jgi:hypothetical protein
MTEVKALTVVILLEMEMVNTVQVVVALHKQEDQEFLTLSEKVTVVMAQQIQ